MSFAGPLASQRRTKRMIAANHFSLASSASARSRIRSAGAGALLSLALLMTRSNADLRLVANFLFRFAVTADCARHSLRTQHQSPTRRDRTGCGTGRVLLGDGHDDVLPLAVDARDHKLGEFRQNGERFICRDMLIGVGLIPSDIKIVDLWNCGRCSLSDGRSARCSLRLVYGSN